MPTVDTLALTTLANVHRHLEIADATTTWDNILIDLINGVTAMIENYCNRKFKLPSSASYTEYFDGQGKNQVAVKNRPITEVTALYDDPNHDYGSDTLLNTSSYEVYYNEGIIKLVDDSELVLSPGVFFDAQKNVKVIYKAGYSTIPYDIEQACNKWVMKLFRTREKDGISAERLGSYSVNYQDLKDIPIDIKTMLDPYVNINI